MKKIIASIKLAPGNRGYFDPLTGINLTIWFVLVLSTGLDQALTDVSPRNWINNAE